MLSTFIKLSFVIKIFVLFILSGRFTQVLFYWCRTPSRSKNGTPPLTELTGSAHADDESQIYAVTYIKMFRKFAVLQCRDTVPPELHLSKYRDRTCFFMH